MEGWRNAKGQGRGDRRGQHGLRPCVLPVRGRGAGNGPCGRVRRGPLAPRGVPRALFRRAVLRGLPRAARGRRGGRGDRGGAAPPARADKLTLS